MLRKIVIALLAVATLAYPAAVYLALGRVGHQWLLAALAVLAVSRAVFARELFWWVVAAGVVVLCAAGWTRADALAVKLYPVLVNTVLLAVFAWSLRHPPSVVERLARRSEPQLPPAGVRYTAQVTAMWCIFLGINGGIAMATVLWGSDGAWAFYNGFLAYIFMGCVAAGEWLVRQRVKAAAPREPT